MRVPFEHLERLMACNGGNFHWVESLFKEPAGGLVPEILKGQAGQEGRIRFLSTIFAFLFVGGSGLGNGPDKCCRD
jgi:hypothetical protein